MNNSDLLEGFAVEIEDALKRFDDSEYIADMLYDADYIEHYVASEGADHIRCQRLAMLELQRKFADLVREVDGESLEIEVHEERDSDSDIMVLPISDLLMSVRTENVLKQNGVYYLHDLLKLSVIDVMKMGGAGKKTVNEVKQIAEPYGGLKTT